MNATALQQAVTPQQIASEITEFKNLLGIGNTELATLLRNPGEDYPSRGLVLTMLLAQQKPSDRFVRLLRARRKEVDLQMQAASMLLRSQAACRECSISLRKGT